jgi:hypothetical protein
MLPVLKHRQIQCRKKKRDRHAVEDEEAEDAELLADEDEDGTARGHRLSVQPSVIKHGTMREYQVQGLNWLIHLYDNGINGILADEMVCSSHEPSHVPLHVCMLAVAVVLTLPTSFYRYGLWIMLRL